MLELEEIIIKKLRGEGILGYITVRANSFYHGYSVTISTSLLSFIYNIHDVNNFLTCQDKYINDIVREYKNYIISQFIDKGDK